MCGRFEQDPGNDEIAKVQSQAEKSLDQYELPLEVAQGEIFPTNTVAVLISVAQGVEAVPMRWGFPEPHYMGKGVIINTVAETALSKPMFRDSLLQRRLAVPVAGFYEWRDESTAEQKKPKVMYHFTREPGRLAFLAGLYKQFLGKEGTLLNHFTILTTSPTEMMSHYHNRMPVLLEESELDDWFLGDRLDYFLHRPQFDLQALKV